MTTQTITLFPSIVPDSFRVYPYTSDKVKGAGFYGQTDALHTVQYSTTNGFVGIMLIQATLELNPTEDDWFAVGNTAVGNGLTPVADQTLLVNFPGNFVWVRAVILSFTAGNINRVLYNHN
jgi:hypothetical protein